MTARINPEHIKDAFRLARSGSYTTATQLMKAFGERYPQLSREQVRSVFVELAKTATRHPEKPA
jgi:hypothetical protein